MLRYLVDEADDKTPETPLTPSDWRVEVAANAPMQLNGYDCGVYVCMYAYYLSVGRVPSFTQDDVSTFRRRILLNIVQKRVD